MTRHIPCAVDDAELEGGKVERLSIVLERQISYSADEASFDGLMAHLGPDGPWPQIFRVIRGSLGREQPWRPFARWEAEGLDASLEDLVAGLTNLDPNRRLTAAQALEHAWFRGVP